MRSMIFAKDLPRLEAFYAEAFGLKAVEATRLVNWVEFEEGEFSLHAIPAEIAAEIEIAIPPEPRDQQTIKLFFEVEDEAIALARLSALGASILERPWGGREAIDPEGNVIGLYTRR
jgi:predicted enzyme related to lactoylglutathione lyase